MEVGRALPVVDGGAATAAVALIAVIETMAEAVSVSKVVDVPSIGASVPEATAVTLTPAWTCPSLI